MAPAAINRAIEVLQAEHPGLTVSCRFHQGDAARPATTLPLPGPTVERITGLAIDADTQKRLLGAIGFACEGDTVTVPWWRAKDVTRAVELVEEVARQFGYEHLTAAAPRMPTTVPARNRERESEHRLRRSLSGRGWDEIASYVFTSDAWAERLGWDEAERIAVRNPCASDQTIMRRSLVPGLLDAVIRNRRNFDRVQVYEIGRIYGQGIGLAPKVDECLVWSGACASADETPPFYGARDAAIGALADLGYTATIDADALLPAALIPGRGCGLVVDGMPVGLVGEFTRELVQDSGGDESVAFFTVDLERLVRDLPEPSPIQFTVPSRYQAVDREFTFVCPESLPYATVAAAAAKGAGKLFKGADLVTVYRGDPIANGQKALSLRITLCSDDKSLGDKDLQKAERKIIGSVENQTPAKLRA
jgi:phenylalanyl-tRNA synthetase beta chain